MKTCKPSLAAVDVTLAHFAMCSGLSRRHVVFLMFNRGSGGLKHADLETSH